MKMMLVMVEMMIENATFAIINNNNNNNNHHHHHNNDEILTLAIYNLMYLKKKNEYQTNLIDH